MTNIQKLMVCAVSAILSACGKDGDSGTSSGNDTGEQRAEPEAHTWEEYRVPNRTDDVPCSGANNASANIESVHFAQTHAMEPDWPFFFLVGDRPALAEVVVTGEGTSPEVSVTAFIDGEEIESLCLAGPDILGMEGTADSHSRDDRFTVTLPNRWVTAGLALEVRAGDSVISYDANTLGITHAPELNLMLIEAADEHDSVELRFGVRAVEVEPATGSVVFESINDGVILTDIRASDPRVELVQHLGISAVTLGVPDVASPFTSVSADDGAGIRLVVEHLASLGHRRVAHVAGPEGMLHARRRHDAFRTAADAAGFNTRTVEADFSAADGARATAALLDSPEPPTALVYSNDSMAVAGIGVAHQRGLRVPGDLSITGFDDTEIGRYIHPALTTVATDARGWGATTARALLAAIAGDDPRHVELADPTLTVRASTGPAPTPAA